MIKKIFVSVAVLVLIVPVFAVDDDMSWMMDMGADDPLASADSGGLPGEGAAGFSDDDLLFGAEPGGAAGAAEDDLFFGMDAGTTGAATAPSGFGDDDLLFGAAPETGADDFGMDFGMDMGMDAGADDPFGFGAAPAPELPDPATPRPAAKPAAPKPAGPMYLSAVPETNIVYSKSNSIGQIRTLRDLVPFGIIATSNLDDEHAASNLVDGRLDTAWVERRMTGGEGEALTLDFSEYYFARVYERKARAVKVE
ncbi:MAG TPA: hypothetical protein ENN43_00910, partial [bacterium]|nr:hypothetical protein [bacterium]